MSCGRYLCIFSVHGCMYPSTRVPPSTKHQLLPSCASDLASFWLQTAKHYSTRANILLASTMFGASTLVLNGGSTPVFTTTLRKEKSSPNPESRIQNSQPTTTKMRCGAVQARESSSHRLMHTIWMRQSPCSAPGPASCSISMACGPRPTQQLPPQVECDAAGWLGDCQHLASCSNRRPRVHDMRPAARCRQEQGASKTTPHASWHLLAREEPSQAPSTLSIMYMVSLQTVCCI